MGNLADRIRSQSMQLARAMAPNYRKAHNIHQALLQFVGTDQPIAYDDNQKEYVEKGYSYNPDVYAVVNTITNACRGVKFAVYEVTDSHKHRKYQRLPSEAKQHQLDKVLRYKHQSLVEVGKDDFLAKVLERPNKLQAFPEFIENAIGFKLITGNAYIHGAKLENGANAGLIKNLYVLPSQYMRIRASKTDENAVVGYVLELTSGMTSTQSVTFPEDEIMHLKYWNPDYDGDGSHLYGLSPLRAGARVVRQSNDSYTAQMAQLQNSGAMGILAVEPETMTEEQARQLERDYYRKYTGSFNRGKIVVAGANMEWKQIGLSPVDLNIIESQKMSLRDICNVYGINSALLNDPDNKVYNNVSEARKALYMERVLPELDSFRDELNRWLTTNHNEVTGKNYYIDYDLDSIPAIQSDMAAVIDQIKDSWWITANEKRIAMGYDDDPIMNQYFIPANFIPFGSPTDDEIKAVTEFKLEKSFNNYPKSASDLARRAIEYTEKNPNDCATAVGLRRARDLAARKPLSLDVVKRTFSYLSRAEVYNKDSFEDKDGNVICGSVSFAYWGGKSMLNWSRKIVEENA
tara:strand:- start:1547 stop:3271 length:1725 start_codon:yes stop_codon:yes gene_type:complete